MKDKINNKDEIYKKGGAGKQRVGGSSDMGSQQKRGGPNKAVKGGRNQIPDTVSPSVMEIDDEELTQGSCGGEEQSRSLTGGSDIRVQKGGMETLKHIEGNQEEERVNIQDNGATTSGGRQNTSGKRTTVDMWGTDVEGDEKQQREVRAKLQKNGDVTTHNNNQIKLLGKRKMDESVEVDYGLDKTYGRDVRSKRQHQSLEGGEIELDIDESGEKLTQKQLASRHGKNITDRSLQQQGDIAEQPIEHIDKEVDDNGEKLTQRQELMGEPNDTGRLDKGDEDDDEEEERGESFEKKHQASQESQKTTDRQMHNQRMVEEIAGDTEENIEQQQKKQHQASQQKETTHDRSMQQQHNKRGGEDHQQQQQQHQKKDPDNNDNVGNNSGYNNREKTPLLSKMRDEVREKIAIGGWGKRSMDIRGNGNNKRMVGINNMGSMGRGEAMIIKAGRRGTSIIHITPQHQQQQHTPQHQQQQHNRGDRTTNSRTTSYTHDSLLGVGGNSEKRNENVGMSFAKSTKHMDMNDGKADQHQRDRRGNLMGNTRNHLIFNEDEGSQQQQSEEYYYPGGGPAKEKGLKRKSEAVIIQRDILEQQHVAEDGNKDAAEERGGDKRRRKEKGGGVQKGKENVERDEEGKDGEGDHDAITRNRTEEEMIGSKGGDPSTQEEEGSEGNDDDGVIGAKAAFLGISVLTARFLMAKEGEVSKQAFDKCFPFGIEEID